MRIGFSFTTSPLLAPQVVGDLGENYSQNKRYAPETTVPTATGSTATYPQGGASRTIGAAYIWDEGDPPDPGDMGWWHADGAYIFDPIVWGKSTVHGTG